MKRRRKEKPFLDQLEKVPNISFACEKVGISRNTIYRWRNEDPEFDRKINEAFSNGIGAINDLAEGKLITKINQGSMPTIKYWLDNNSKRYFRPRPRDFWEKHNAPKPIGAIEFYVVESKDAEPIHDQTIEIPTPPEQSPPSYP